MSRTVADLMVEVLVEAGARRCYGVPGDTLNHFTDAVRRSPLRWIHVRHEEVGALAAGADALLTDELAVCAGSCGPGSLHFANGVWESNRNRAPVVLIASQLPRDDLGSEFPQEVDLRGVYSSGSVFCEEIRTPGQARRMTALAAQAALHRRGVAVLVVPVDVSRAAAGDEPKVLAHRSRPQTVPSAEELARIADALNGGGKVTIYGGSGCRNARDQVIALADRLKAPVARTSRAKDFLEADNPFDVGMTGLFGTSGGYGAVEGCDILLLLGCDFAWRQFYPSKATIIQIDIDGAHLGRRTPVDVAAVGDVGPTLDALLPLITVRDDRRFLEARLKHARSAEAALGKRAVEGGRGVIHPQFLAETIARQAPADTVFTADGGSPMVWCLRHIPATGRNRTVVSLTHGTMANAMPQALGAKAAFPDRTVIALSGDGGLAMLLGDLLTAVQENLAIKVAVFNNGALGFVEVEQKVEGLLEAFTALRNPDFGRVAEALGLWGRRVTDPEEVGDAVAAWLAAPGPALLDVQVAATELVIPPKVEPGQVAGMALYAAKGLLAGPGEARAVVDLVEGVLIP